MLEGGINYSDNLGGHKYGLVRPQAQFQARVMSAYCVFVWSSSVPDGCPPHASCVSPSLPETFACVCSSSRAFNSYQCTHVPSFLQIIM